LYKLDPLYGLLLTFGLALIFEGVMRDQFGSGGLSYPVPDALQGSLNLGFMILPVYRAWVIVASITVCLVTWFVIERTRLGATLRAATENPKLVQAFESYVISQDGQKAAADQAGSSPISDTLREQSQKAIDAITSQ